MAIEQIEKVFQTLDLATEEKRKVFHRMALAAGVTDKDKPVLFDGNGTNSRAATTC